MTTLSTRPLLATLLSAPLTPCSPLRSTTLAPRHGLVSPAYSTWVFPSSRKWASSAPSSSQRPSLRIRISFRQPGLPGWRKLLTKGGEGKLSDVLDRSEAVKRLQRKEAWRRRIPLLPALLFSIVVTQVPFVLALYFSFTKWEVFKTDPRRWIWFDNYTSLWDNRFFRQAGWNTIVMVVSSVLLSVILGTLLALLLDRKFFGQGFVRTLLITPEDDANTDPQLIFDPTLDRYRDVTADKQNLLSFSEAFFNSFWAVLISTIIVMVLVRYEDATRIYPGSEEPAVNKLNLDITDGELLVLVGPSGSGKSTALRMLAGLEFVDRGSVFIGDRDVTLVPPKDRDIAMVFQNYALYPQMTVAANMGFALKQKGMPKDERRQRVVEAARILDLEPYLDRKPKNLSGGQRQRVAMGRAIVRSPQVFLMDEPLSNLDAKLRVQTRTELADLQARLGVTTVYVTHDQVEAMTMGHRVAVLKDGFLQQVDKPRTLYSAPTNAFSSARKPLCMSKPNIRASALFWWFVRQAKPVSLVVTTCRLVTTGRFMSLVPMANASAPQPVTNNPPGGGPPAFPSFGGHAAGDSIEKPLPGRIALVTGAAGDIGRAVCVRLSRLAVVVVAADLDVASEGMAKTLASCRDAGAAEDAVHPTAFDVTDHGAVAAAVADVCASVGVPTIVCNNAGYQGDFANIVDANVDDFERVMRINVTGVFSVPIAVMFAVMATAELVYNPYAFDLHDDPYDLYRRLRDDAPAYWNPELKFWVISRFADVLDGFRNFDLFSSEGGVALEARRKQGDEVLFQQMIELDPPDHTSFRKLVSRVFTGRRVAEMEVEIRRIFNTHLDKIIDAGDTSSTIWLLGNKTVAKGSSPTCWEPAPRCRCSIWRPQRWTSRLSRVLRPRRARPRWLPTAMTCRWPAVWAAHATAWTTSLRPSMTPCPASITWRVTSSEANTLNRPPSKEKPAMSDEKSAYERGLDMIEKYEAMMLSFQTYRPMYDVFAPDFRVGREIEIPSVEPAKDGSVGYCTVTGQQWQDFCNMIGAPEWIDDPVLSTFRGRMARRDEVLERIHAFTTQHTVDELWLTRWPRWTISSNEVCLWRTRMGSPSLARPIDSASQSLRPLRPAPKLNQHEDLSPPTGRCAQAGPQSLGAVGSPRVTEGWGLTWEAVQELNPATSLIRVPAFGLDGPWRDRVGFAMTMEQVSGLANRTGHADGPPLNPRGPVDSLAGMHSVFGGLLALAERERTGRGQLVEMALIEGALQAAAEQVIEYSAYGNVLSSHGQPIGFGFAAGSVSGGRRRLSGWPSVWRPTTNGSSCNRLWATAWMVSIATPTTTRSIGVITRVVGAHRG
ncbi:Maltodextrin import ATP-binding protein MsmX [Nymphon striatum]|nr:Maltodextrin import ATP-binding protein MsmX [Nymphon striatum]